MSSQQSDKRPARLSARVVLAAAAAATAAGAGRLAGAATLYWQATAPNSWNTPGNWSDLAAGGGANQVPTINDTATFNTAGNNTPAIVTLDANQSAAGIVVTTTSTSGATITAGTAGPFSLALNSGGLSVTSLSSLTIGSSNATQNVSILLAADQIWATNSTASSAALIISVPGSVSAQNAGPTTLTLAGTTGSSSLNAISGVISNGGTDRTVNIVMSPPTTGGGGNRWTLSGNNTYTGTTTVNNGALTVGNPNALGGTSAGTTVVAGAGLFFRASVGTIAAEPLTLAGNGANVGAVGSLRNVAGNNNWTGVISADTTVTGGTVIGSDAGTFQVNQSAVITTTGTNALGFTGAGAIVVNAAINGPAAVTRAAGAGTLTFAFDNKTYTGATNVNAGTLQLNTALTATSAVNVAAGATLRGAGGSINSAATTTVNGSISGGTAAATIGTLATGPLTLTGTGTFSLDINSATVASDLVNVTGNLTLNTGNTSALTVADPGATVLPAGTTIPFIDYSGTWNGGLFTLAGTGVLTNKGTTFQVGSNFFQVDYSFGGPNGAVALVSVPEPAAGAFLLAAATGFLAVRRRRRSRGA